MSESIQNINLFDRVVYLINTPEYSEYIKTIMSTSNNNKLTIFEAFYNIEISTRDKDKNKDKNKEIHMISCVPDLITKIYGYKNDSYCSYYRYNPCDRMFGYRVLLYTTMDWNTFPPRIKTVIDVRSCDSYPEKFIYSIGNKLLSVFNTMRGSFHTM